MTVLDHVHGVVSTKCKHPECVAAFARYAKRWRLDRARGQKRNVDSHAVRMHIATLQGSGWSLRAIAGEAGVSPSFVSRVLKHRQPQVRRTTALAILNIDPESLPSKPSATVSEPNVPKLGACRRIEALLTLGWTHEAMRSHCGIATHIVLSQQGGWIRRSTHDRIAAMYRDLSGRPGPSERTRQRAARLGYVGPLGWNDIDRDPAPESDDVEDVALCRVEEVDEAAVYRRMHGDKDVRLSKADAAALVERCFKAGWTWSEIETRTGVNPDRHRGGDAA